MKNMNTINEINDKTIEGKYLMMALAALTCSPEVHINGKIVRGSATEPDVMLKEVGEVVSKVYNENNQIN